MGKYILTYTKKGTRTRDCGSYIYKSKQQANKAVKSLQGNSITNKNFRIKRIV